MIRLLNLLIVASLVLLVSSSVIERKKRHVTLFNIVKFDNDPCNSQQTVTTGGGRRKGTCYTEDECSTRSGLASGGCASGFGVCCLFLKTSGTATQNCTYLRNEGFPSAQTNTMAVTTNSFIVRKCDSHVCRLRLDFETFQIGGPNLAAGDPVGDAECTDGLLVTTSTNSFIPTICGVNTGQHIWVDFPSNSDGQITLDFGFSADTITRMYEIKATQYNCNDKNLPPVGCLQYHTGGTGRIKTFNFDGDTAHLNNQDYNICVRQEKDMCCVEYSVCSDIPEDESFSLIGNAALTDDTMLAAGVDDDCLGNLADDADTTVRNDMITIPGATQQCGCTNLFPPVSRFCGNRLHAITGAKAHIPICDCTPPFDIQVFTDGDDDTDDPTGVNDGVATLQSRGVCLDYKQTPC